MRQHLAWLLLVVCSSARADSADEIQARLRRWETNLPQYTLSPNVKPAVIGPSVTAVYAQDRTNALGDPLAREFLQRGYYLLKALRTRRDLAPLTRAEVRRFHEALRTSRIVFVDRELFDNQGKRVVAVTDPDPQAPAYRLIQVYRPDWEESARLQADLTLFVFHEYLRAIGKFDDEYVLSRDLTVSEKDYRRTFTAMPDCPSGEQAPASIGLNLPIGSTYALAAALVNGVAISGSSHFRTAKTTPLCTARAHRFDIEVADYRKSVYLYGGDDLTVMIPSDKEYYNP